MEDVLSRIQEKYAGIPEDLGRDIKAVQGFLKKHEGFENELAALEAQVSGHRHYDGDQSLKKCRFESGGNMRNQVGPLQKISN